MRILFSGLVAAGLLSSHLAAAECARPADNSAFDVTGLKTQLMVTALTCHADDRYNAFVVKFRPDLVQQEKSLNGYFSRAYGRAAGKRHDDFITQVANDKSRAGLRDGTLFCDHNLVAFDEVMALKTSAELADYAAGRAAVAPETVGSCGGPTERTATRTASRRTTRHRS
ncbi:MAG: hypothetical protein NVSMB18_04240 [Acetobacteraceae bacterium]